jgi:methylmalonyl-CoA/ethylmalonyl-CoA epimerase
LAISDTGEDRVKEIDHIGVVVDNLEEAEAFLADVLKLEPERKLNAPDRGFRAAFFGCGPVSIEVIEVLDPEARRLRLGAATKARIEHVALRVDDLNDEAQRLSRLGVRMRGSADPRAETAEPAKVGDTLNLWTDPDTSDGVSYQLIGPARPGK